MQQMYENVHPNLALVLLFICTDVECGKGLLTKVVVFFLQEGGGGGRGWGGERGLGKMTFKPVHHCYRLVFIAPCSHYKFIRITKSIESQARVNISNTVTERAPGCVTW